MLRATVTGSVWMTRRVDSLPSGALLEVKTDDGATQTFVAPAGATRLFLAGWDFYEWNNNAGDRTVKISRPSKIMTVK